MISMEMEHGTLRTAAPRLSPGRSLRLVTGGVLVLVVAWGYHLTLERARVVSAVSELDAIATLVDDFHARHGRYPESLAEVDADERLDPWGRRYGYGPGNSTAVPRPDHQAGPISGYDLWSAGPDGKRSPGGGRGDDVVRGRDGAISGPGVGL